MFEPRSYYLCGDTNNKHFIHFNEDQTVEDVNVKKRETRALYLQYTQSWRAV